MSQDLGNWEKMGNYNLKYRDLFLDIMLNV